jgi:hypothetical protein
VPPAARREPDALGKLLLSSGAITREALDKALVFQRQSFMPLGRILRDEAGLSVEALAGALRKQTHAPRIYLRFFPIEREVVDLLDANFCQQHEVMAFEKLGGLLCIAMSNPAQRAVVRHVEIVTGMEVLAFRAPWEDIQKKLRK